VNRKIKVDVNTTALAPIDKENPLVAAFATKDLERKREIASKKINGNIKFEYSNSGSNIYILF
jgi:hypothetical protein